MTFTRANVEAAKGLIRYRLGNPYKYGGALSETNIGQGTDCSEVWQTVLERVRGRWVVGRQAEGATTESYRPKTMGGPIPIGGGGPFGTIVVASPADIPADAVVKLAFHHGPGGGENSHMWGELDGMRIESAASKGLVTQPAAWPIDHPYANSWAYLPGPITEDGTPVTIIEPQDTLFADVSEWQRPVDDSYPYRVLTIRSNDGTYRDKNWATNYAWCKAAADSGKLAFFIVYFVWRTNWEDAIATLKSQIGQPHPRMAIMLDVESWNGQIRGDQSAGINGAFGQLVDWLGDPRRVIGYGNTGDLDALWPHKPDGIRLVVAGYGKLPTYPGMIAHQYTDGQGYGGGLPEGAPPFGNCDMNAANGLTATAFAQALGIDVPAQPQPTDPETDVTLHTSRSIYRTSNERTMRGDDASLGADACGHMNWVEQNAIRGARWALLLVQATAAGGVGATKWWEVDAGNPNPGIDPWAIEQATNVLTYIETTNPAVLQGFLATQKGA
ncbi:hypothetical protein ACJEIK_26210 [Mycobacterium sp. SMC-16]|uniref:hypothetical protein n=1 Tax=Mycobacterium sp. SMC-16 TaxID=3385967 RepID=UPI00390C7637